MGVTAARTSPVEGHAPAEAPRSVSVLGSTGSIGCNTLDLIRRNRDRYQIVALTAHRNVAELIAQVREFEPEVAVIGDPALYGELKQAAEGLRTRPAAGPEALVEAADRPADWVMAGIVGAAGLAPTLAAVNRGAAIALANKECLVCAGDLFMAAVSASGATLLPVDSEHNAIFQVLEADQIDKVDRIILTASGGPFRTATREQMAAATPAQAIAHPNWTMGAKISVDSATLMNKGLELIEAHYLFPVREEQIEVLIHPQSVIHSMVAYVDGSVLAQLGTPDMRTPIAHALAWPNRMAAPAERLDLAAIGSLTFETPDLERFPALGLARAALQRGGGAPTILNAANEVAVEGFLKQRIGLLDISRIVGEVLERVEAQGGFTGTGDRGTGDRPPSLTDVLSLDAEARRIAQSLLPA